MLMANSKNYFPVLRGSFEEAKASSKSLMMTLKIAE